MELRDQTAAFAEVVAGADPSTRVPACPDWLLRDLVGHIGQASRWAAGIVRSGPSPAPDPRDAEPGPPDGWTDWLLAGADELLAEVEAAEAPVWTVVGPGPASWWVRRLLSDLVVHTADAAFTVGAPFGVSTALAADTIAEALNLLGLAKIRGDRTGTIALRPSTGDGWLIARPDWRRGAGDADVTLSGSTQDLLLVLMRRLPLDHVSVTGDRRLVEELLTYEL
ncbi:maleylpyruvate isomerase family mycothiol-dependent enzyme [Actinophytocola oryzae]|uniref:Uncharacterized protein (TIGR03083 family) n=1 Tax=Actinophytocola oryzae TaxID=502181 RepID=A0A4R7VRR9_9PSEU|nr:maleylpyruvate isomerase family mycothiol-dependent enzyme [Actinophytocola oryzae]TDV51917.1 uncharacterized protein (TIGR03083 family) [Actinophytocola oryzae]